MTATRRGRISVPASERDDRPRLRLKAPDPFEAIADPTRRAILELVGKSGERTAGTIAAAFPRVTRPAVSRHLRILRESGLVVVRASGRQRQYALDVRALHDLHRNWFEQFAPLWDQALCKLKRNVESKPAAGSKR
jgi:DNA-binding transcriptional ArsR family regulator